MIGNFRLAVAFSARLSARVYEDVFYDRFNSVFKGFYLVVGRERLAEMVQRGEGIAFIKIPSAERFGSQDVSRLEYADPSLLTDDQKKLIYLLNAVIESGGYRTYREDDPDAPYGARGGL